jgi:hypothetical protein
MPLQGDRKGRRYLPFSIYPTANTPPDEKGGVLCFTC